MACHYSAQLWRQPLNPYDAQELVKSHEAELGMNVLTFNEMLYLPDEDRYVEEHEVPDGAKPTSISGTEVREKYLAKGHMLAFASPASASATKCASWGPVQLVGHSIPTGQYCFSVSGSGTRINFTNSSFNTGWIYSPQEVVHFKDTRGREYATFYTYHQSGWVMGGYHPWKTGISGTAKPGTACGELLSSGASVATTCLRIG